MVFPRWDSECAGSRASVVQASVSKRAHPTELWGPATCSAPYPQLISHQVQRPCRADPRPPHTVRALPGPEGQRLLRQGRIRRACFSFTGASWVLMALLMLMAWEGTEEAEVRDPPGRLPQKAHRTDSSASGRQRKWPFSQPNVTRAQKTYF